jgi:hypothetical protein
MPSPPPFAVDLKPENWTRDRDKTIQGQFERRVLLEVGIA